MIAGLSKRVVCGTALMASCTVLKLPLPSAATTKLVWAETMLTVKSREAAAAKRISRVFRLGITAGPRLRPTRAGIETSSFACRLDLHVLEEYRTARIYDLARFYAAENTVYKGYVINHRAGKTGNPHHARTRRALNIFECDVAHDRFVGPVWTGLVHEIDRQDRFLDAANVDVAHEHVLS